MAITEWWDGHPEQRFWMEATDRKDLGEDLRAPKEGGTGKSVWHYELVAHVQPGDVVFHWHTSLLGRPALVGWSLAMGPLHEELHPWTAHAGVNAADAAIPRPNWIMPLGALHFFDEPIDNADLAGVRDGLMGLLAQLQGNYSGLKYFPFNKYDDNQVRASQAYATKFPSELVTFFVTELGLDFDPDEAGDVPVDEPPIIPGAGSTTGGQGYSRDVALKIAIETHAIEKARAYYQSVHASKVEEVGKPFDLRVTKGDTEIRVEVKGSATTASSVLVTSGEVDHAATFGAVELFVVDEIKWLRQEDGTIATSGGRMRRWPLWSPNQSNLIAKSYKHNLTTDSELLETS
jgi:hypothetical protein